MVRCLMLLLILIAFQTKAQNASNDDISHAINITNPSAFCSEDAAFNNFNATSANAPSQYWNGKNGKDVWFKFTAIKLNATIFITSRSNASSPNTLRGALTALYTMDPITGALTELAGEFNSDISRGILITQGLTIGQVYYIRVSGWDAEEGTFKLCLDNYAPPLPAGPDCDNFSIICSKEKFTQTKVTGPGLKPNEVAGTCLPNENNSSWYRFSVSKSGALTFLITPTSIDNDIDWVLYDLGPNGDCSNVSAATAIRCAAGHGVGCTPIYYVTGLSLTETDTQEGSGCGADKNGLVKYIDAIAGHNYALIIDNFTIGDRGFYVEFNGTAELSGPISKIKLDKIASCTPQQSYTFTSESTNYNSLKWSFGEGASIASATTAGPINVTYTTPGVKTVTLEAMTDRGCNVVSSVNFVVSYKPLTPSITVSHTKFCAGDRVTLSAESVVDATYHWTGPNGFDSKEQNPELTISGPESAGDYQLTIQVGECTSEPATLNIPTVDPKPIAYFEKVINNACMVNQSYTFKNGSKNYSALSWDVGSGVASTTTANNGDITVVYATKGVKDIVLKVKSPNQCEATFTMQINVQLKPTPPVISLNRTAFCLGDVLKMAVIEEPELSYHWTGPNNFTATTAAVEIPISDFNQAGIYEVFTQVGDCKSNTVSVTIPPIAKVPIASFTTVPGYSGKYVAPFPITFQNRSKEADHYLWDFGDGFTTTETSPKHTFAQSGTYKIKLTAFADEGCSTSTDIGDLVIKNATLFIPNTFTPNGDGINDEFVVTILNLKKYKLFIYNRAGQNVFESVDIFNNWNGKYKNKDVPAGIYYYVIYGTNVYDIEQKYTGSLTLIR